jgi:type IV pilus assembly PilN-like protein
MSQQINLFNPQFLHKKKHFSAVTMTQALGLLVLGIAVFYGYALWQDRTMARQAAESSRAHDLQKQQFARASAQLNPEKLEAQIDQDLKSAEAAVALRRALLSEIQSGAGRPSVYSEYLRAFARQTVQGLWLTGIQIGETGGQLSLSGRALQPELVPVLISRLRQETVLRGRPLEALSITRSAAGAEASKHAIVEFTVTSPAQPGAEKPRS